MTKLVKLLRQAHAIEVGAYNAYEGHYKSLPDDSDERHKIFLIRQEENIHREILKRMLAEFGAKPSRFQDAILWVIGKSISIACSFMGYRMAMWGARMMERLGAVCYHKIALEALNEGRRDLAKQLIEMQKNEQDHEKYFMSILEPKCQCRYLRYLSGATAREANPFCGAKHKF